MVTRFYCFLTGLVGLLFSALVFAEQRALHMVYSDHWHPYSFLNDQTEPDGLLVRRMDRLFGEQLGLAIEHHVLPWKRAQKLVEMGRYDAMVAVPTQSRLAYAERSNSVLYRFRVRAFLSEHSPRFGQLKQSESPFNVPGIRCITMLGDKSSEKICRSRGIDCDSVANVGLAINMLKAGRVDFFVHSQDSVDSYLKGADGDGVTMHDSELNSVSAVLMVSRKSSFAGELVKQVDDVLAESDLSAP